MKVVLLFDEEYNIYVPYYLNDNGTLVLINPFDY